MKGASKGKAAGTSLDFDIYLQRKAVAKERIGATPISQLRWVLEFAAADLSRLLPDERRRLGDCLRELIDTREWHPEYNAAHDMPDQLLRELHSEIKEGLRLLFHTQPGESWKFPLPDTIELRRMSPPKQRRVKYQFFHMANERASVLGGIASLFRQCEKNVSSCERCSNPFVRVHKQKFCSEKCSQDERNDRRRRKAKEHRRP